MKERLEAVRRYLAEQGFDAFFSFSPPANQYLTGFTGTTSAVVVSAKDAVFLCDFRYTEQAGVQVRDFEVREIAGTLETRAGELLKELGANTAAFNNTEHSVWQIETIATAFGGRVCPDPAALTALRQTKDAGELQQIQAAARLTDEVIIEIAGSLKLGVTERETAARLEYEFKKRGASGPSFDSIVLFGPRSSLPHGMPGGKALESGDIVLIDCGCRLGGYCSDLTRTYAFDTIPGAWFEEIYRITLAAQEKALSAIRPGMLCREVDAVARTLIAEAGYGTNFGHGLGHGVGIEIHESPRLNKESEVVLEPGMVVTVEPGIYLPGRGGVRIEDLVAVTEDGCRILSQTPKQLKVLGA